MPAGRSPRRPRLLDQAWSEGERVRGRQFERCRAVYQRLYHFGVNEGRISLNRFVELVATTPARLSHGWRSSWTAARTTAHPGAVGS